MMGEPCFHNRINMYNIQKKTKDGKSMTYPEMQKEMDRDLSEGRTITVVNGDSVKVTTPQQWREERALYASMAQEMPCLAPTKVTTEGLATTSDGRTTVMTEEQTMTATVMTEGQMMMIEWPTTTERPAAAEQPETTEQLTTTGGRSTATMEGQLTVTEQVTATDGRTTVMMEEHVTMTEQVMTTDGRTTETSDDQTPATEDVDGQTMVTGSHPEEVRMEEPAGTSDVLTVDGLPLSPVVAVEDEPVVEVDPLACPLSPAVMEEESMLVEVDPLACPLSSSFKSVEGTESSLKLDSPLRPIAGSSATPRRLFVSADDSTPPSVAGPMRKALAKYKVDMNVDSILKSRKVVGRKQPVITDEDDVDSLSSTSVASAVLDSSMTSSSKTKKKRGVKRGREVSKDKGKIGSEEESKKKKEKGRKDIGRKETPEDVEEMVGPCGEPKGLVDCAIEDMSSSVLGASIMEWANGIDEIRLKSKNLQGKLSGDLKKCVTKIKEGTTLLMIRAEASGDPHFLRMRNLELSTQLRKLERDNARLEEQLRRMSLGSPSPLRKKRAVKTVDVDIPLVDSDVPSDLPLKEDFPPLPQRSPRVREIKDGAKKKVGPRIVSDVQVALPFNERRNVERVIPEVPVPETEWRVAAGSKRRGRVKGDGPPPPPPPSSSAPVQRQPPVAGQQLKQPKIRLPRPPASSAVTITGRAEGFSYANALRSARENIDLASLGIETKQVRRARNGGLLIEVSGEESRIKAEELASRIRTLLKDTAAVSCPLKKRELNVIGFDESVNVEDIIEVLSTTGGCSKADIRLGPIRTLNSGLGIVWAQLPEMAAMKVAQEGRVRVGWTSARVELLKVRPLQCFKCWSYGHVQNTCRSGIDRRGACFKCGQMGHMAGTCTSPAHCALCHDAKLEASHRMGGPQCSAQEHQALKK